MSARLMPFVDIALDPRVQRIAEHLAWILKARLTVPLVAGVIAVGMLVWVIAGVRLRGMTHLLWLLVPVLALVASAAVAGPGRLFSKKAHEGKSVILLTRKD